VSRVTPVGRVLLDTGPLVALISPEDSRHSECLELWGSLDAPLYTCWPVLTEAAWMLRSRPASVERMLESGNGGALKILGLDEADAAAIADIMKRYSKLRPQLADAALVHLADREKIDTVFTLDQRDFRVYRTKSNRPLRLLP
jgi:predicted nucleic acid-binding protein